MFIIKEEEDFKEFARDFKPFARRYGLRMAVVDTGQMFFCDIRAMDAKREV